MADHGGGKDPISSLVGTLFGGVTGVFTGIFVLGMFLGVVTGNAPIRASLFDVWAWGQMAGAWIHAGGNSGIQTFGDKNYFENSKKIGSDAKPDQRLMAPNSTPSTILPTSAKATNDASVTELTTQAPIAYTDTNGDGIISPEEIATQNKAR